MKREVCKYLSDDEAKKLLAIFVSSNPKATDDDCLKLLDWAGRAKMEHDLMGLVMDGKVVVTLVGGELRFSASNKGAITPSFSRPKEAQPLRP